MTQQNKGISKTFYYIRKKQSSLPWNKVKAPQKIATWSFSSSNSSSSISGSSRTKKRRKRYTKYTEEKEAEDENWQKNADFMPFLALFQGKELCFVLCGKKVILPWLLKIIATKNALLISSSSPPSLPPSPLPPPLSLPPSPSLSPSPPPSLAVSLPPLALSLPSRSLSPLPLSLSPPSLPLSPLPLSLSLPSRPLSHSPLPLSLSLSPSLALPLFHSLSPPPPLSLCPSLSLPAQVDAHKSSAHLGVQWKSPHLDPQHTWRLEHVVTVCGPVTVLRVLTPWGLEDCSWRR